MGDIFGEPIHMVVDTGSTICMISLLVWNRVKRNGMTLRTTTTKLWTVDGSVARSYGRRIIPLTIGGVTKKQVVEVTDCQDEFILGMNFMRAHVDGLNFKELRMRMASQDISMKLVNVPWGPQRPRWTKKLMDDRQEEQRRKAVWAGLWRGGEPERGRVVRSRNGLRVRRGLDTSGRAAG